MKVIKFKEALHHPTNKYISTYDVGINTIYNFIRSTARLQSWGGIAGIQEFCKEEFNGRLRHTEKNGWTSLKFDEDEYFDIFLEKFHKSLS